MKLFSLALLAISFNSFATTCPDLSGSYIQKISSCRGDFKTNIGWPLQELETVVTITQDKCNSLTISFPDTRFSNTPIEEVHIDLTQASKLTTSETSIKASFFEPASRVDSMFGTIKASITKKVELEVDGSSLNIVSSSFMNGMINYVIPVLDKDSFNCRVEKI